MTDMREIIARAYRPEVFDQNKKRAHRAASPLTVEAAQNRAFEEADHILSALQREGVMLVRLNTETVEQVVATTVSSASEMMNDSGYEVDAVCRQEAIDHANCYSRIALSALRALSSLQGKDHE